MELLANGVDASGSGTDGAYEQCLVCRGEKLISGGFSTRQRGRAFLFYRIWSDAAYKHCLWRREKRGQLLVASLPTSSPTARVFVVGWWGKSGFEAIVKRLSSTGEELRLTVGLHLFELGRTTFASTVLPSFPPTFNKLLHLGNVPPLSAPRLAGWMFYNKQG